MNIKETIKQYKWDLGVVEIKNGFCYDNDWDIHIIKAPIGKWYADPFILEVTEKQLIILVEEFSYQTKKGQIARIVIDKSNYKIVDEKIIITLDTHLSFPAIYRCKDNVYIYPENSESGCCRYYRYSNTNSSVMCCGVLSDHPLTDAVLLEMGGNNYLFSTEIPNQNANILKIFRSKEALGKYEDYQKIVLPDNTARSAGLFFNDGKKLIRPAQDCNGGYGMGLVFQEVDYLDGVFHLKELFRKKPPYGYCGMHTFNMYGNFAIVDLHKRRHPLLYGILRKIANILK